MAQLGGGAEAHARFKQYEYRANSSLVLTTDTRPRDTHEPTGEPETLWGKINPRSFGDRATQGKPAELEEKAKKKQQAKERERERGLDNITKQPSKRQKVNAAGLGPGLQADGVLALSDDGSYRPRTKETRAAYEALLSMIQQQFGDQPQDILRGAADEVLAVLRNDRLKDMDKKKEIEKLLNGIPNEKFAEYIAVSKKITDYREEGDADGVGGSGGASGEALDDAIGVAVEFGESDEEEDEDLDEVEEEEDNEEGAGEEEDRAMQMHGGLDDDDEQQETEVLNVQDIDAYWLQRKISQAMDQVDAQQSQKLAEQVLETLAESDELRDIENKLVMLLDYDKFDMIKLLLNKRLEIVWCTRLARAEDEGEKAKLEAEMVDTGKPELRKLLEQLHATRATAKERQSNMERRIREEAKKLKGGGAGGEATGDGEELEAGGGGRGGATGGGRELAASAADPSVDAGSWLRVQQRKALDLESLAFQQGSFLMANKKCVLPEGSRRITHKGYDEVHVPALKPKPMEKDEELVKVGDMPEWVRPAFPGMKALNRVQSRVYETAFYTPENLLLCAPTGAGKTNVAVLTILHELGLHRRTDGTLDLGAFKIVYVAPMKALVAEVVGGFSERLKEFGVSVKELTGDATLTRQQIQDTQIIVTTPEKWDIITRKSGDRTYTQLVKLLIIDEIHLLHDNRGPVLESIVARTVRQIESTQEMIRLVGLSATLPNYQDVAVFLRVNIKRGLFFFDNTYRPCPLAQQYIGISIKKPLQRFQLMNEICYEKVMEAAGKHQVLIFCHSRKETAKTAKAIRDMALAKDTLGRFLKEDSATRLMLQEEAENMKSLDLKDLLPYGFAIHHAGLSRTDRTLVEDLFSDKRIQVLVSTATLAWGVNLPAHTVIIKGTQIYNPEKGAWTELSPLDVMQMMGRAGRPQYDTQGEGIIITGHAELQFYLSLLNEQLPIESQFVSKLADNLNAEIVLGSVQGAREATRWLGYTYLYIRMLRNPSLYGITEEEAKRDKVLEERRADLIHSAAVNLDKTSLIKYDRKNGYFQVTDLGRIASFYYISHGTIATYNEHLKPTMGDIELCRLFSLSEEFKYVSVREEEKIELAKLLDRVPIPVKEGIEEPSAKINVLLQAYISQLKLEGLSLASDMVFVTQNAGRLMRALFEIVLKRGWAQLAEKALGLCKMVSRRMWASQTPLRQFKGIPNDILSKVEKKDLAWERYYDLSSQELGELVRFPKIGKNLHKFIHQFPRLELAAHVQPITRSVLKVDLTITPDFQWDEKIHGYVEPFWVLVEDNDGESILHHEYFLLKMQYADEDHLLTFTVPIFEPLPPQYFVRIISDRWLGSDAVLPISFRHLILPEKYPPPTELLDLQPLPVSALRNARFEALYSKQFTHFNPIQTQVFGSLYNSDDNVLVAAPTGSGKTICAEFAVLRMFEKHDPEKAGVLGGRCVYVAPVEALAKERLRDWQEKFGTGGLGARVVELTGESATDLKLLEKANIVIATPQRWDALSRRWKQRKAVQQTELFIVDELHLIGGPDGPVLEVITSRMRYMSSQTDSTVRIVTLSTSLANAKDLGEWIGASSHGLFNFSPSTRPVPLEVHIQGVDITNFEARMQAMPKPTYTAIMQHTVREGADKPVLVFVPTRKHARLTALDLSVYAANDAGVGTAELPVERSAFLHCSMADLEPFLERIHDKALKQSLSYGVGYVHEGLASGDQEVVAQLYGAGAIQVIVASSSMCWSVQPAQLVIVMGTQYYDGRESAQADYPITDLLQMMGRASRPMADQFGKCVILCHAPRKEYYKKFLFEPLPVESHLDQFLHDHMNAEVVVRTIENKQDAVDYITWSFLYRRLTQNPNYYNLLGVTHRHLSDHLSELVESTLTDLESSKCISVLDDMDLEPLNLGMIAAYYYIGYTTIELFASSLTQKTKLKGLLEILTSASEFSSLPVRPGEEETLRKMSNHQRFGLDNPKFGDPHVKANVLLQSHFARYPVQGPLAQDQRAILLDAPRLLQAMVDVVSSSGWLGPALAAMELSQCVTQGLWERDSSLLQLPHMTKELSKKFVDAGVETVADFVDMDDEARAKVLQFTPSQLQDLVKVCNRFPSIDLAYEISDADDIGAGDNVTLLVTLERELAPGQELGPVDAPRYPKTKEEGWWLVVGDSKTNTLLAIKRVALQRRSKVRLEFPAPKTAGDKELMLYFMCDAYLGCDQEFEFTLNVKEADLKEEGEEGEADMEED
eukprot:TRINITY_DN317_c0_g1_i1.p1 TRINITY_DN317_c0_g1~~TRINITY_DN317_c0_g1_i1.p1  ORF type:complete len:2233 (-),score=420.67 TRINITY_DN317_c0_g1_i1:1930-8628(-)